MATPKANSGLLAFREMGIERIESILYVIVTSADEIPTEKQVVMLQDLLSWWENLAKRMASNETYWHNNLPEDEKEKYEKAKYLMSVVLAMYGPREG